MRLHEYLKRIGSDRAVAPTLDALRQLHIAHRETFLFENLSIQEGGSVSVLLEDIERKFLDDGRGGYCFEHNTLFRSVLTELGYSVTSLLGRVRRGPPDRWTRTHMVLRVDVAWVPYLADVGFGAIGIVEPLPLAVGATARQRGITYELRRDESVWVLAMQDATQSMDLYEFADEPQTTGDVIVANHYTSTHPDSIFRKTVTIQRVRGDERVVLRNDTLSRWNGGTLTEETIDRARLPDVARDEFGVTLPDGTLVYER